MLSGEGEVSVVVICGSGIDWNARNGDVEGDLVHLDVQVDGSNVESLVEDCALPFMESQVVSGEKFDKSCFELLGQIIALPLAREVGEAPVDLDTIAVDRVGLLDAQSVKAISARACVESKGNFFSKRFWWENSAAINRRPIVE